MFLGYFGSSAAGMRLSLGAAGQCLPPLLSNLAATPFVLRPSSTLLHCTLLFPSHDSSLPPPLANFPCVACRSPLMTTQIRSEWCQQCEMRTAPTTRLERAQDRPNPPRTSKTWHDLGRLRCMSHEHIWYVFFLLLVHAQALTFIYYRARTTPELKYEDGARCSQRHHHTAFHQPRVSPLERRQLKLATSRYRSMSAERL